jgi:hypothetical protein
MSVMTLLIPQSEMPSPRPPGRAPIRPPGLRSLFVLLALWIACAPLRADLVLEEQNGVTNHFRTVVLTLKGNQMRMDHLDQGFSVIVNLATRDSFTLLTNKTFLNKFGSEVRWEMEEERKLTRGTNQMDAPPLPAVDTGKSEMMNGYQTEIYTWSGARGITQTLWVATNYPNFEAIRVELAKVDQFNATGLHRNQQPLVSRLPGMIVRRDTTRMEHTSTDTLLSARITTVDSSLFEVPKDYTPYKRPEPKP